MCKQCMNEVHTLAGFYVNGMTSCHTQKKLNDNKIIENSKTKWTVPYKYDKKPTCTTRCNIITSE